MTLAPILLFVFRRPQHTARVLEALRQNDLALHSSLYIYSDAPKRGSDLETAAAVRQVRALIRDVKGFKKVFVSELAENRGLWPLIPESVTKLLQTHEKVIVLEDDVVTSPSFLRYMNEALTLYESSDRVMHVSGYMHPIVSNGLGETYFYNAATSWGWGTWRRAWKSYCDDPRYLRAKLREMSDFDRREFNAGFKEMYERQLSLNVKGKLKSWAVRWHASMYLSKGLCLHPRDSLVENIGLDGSGENCGKVSVQPLVFRPKTDVFRIPLEPDLRVLNRIESYEATCL